eukprot:6739155-Prymnesium_polylepis.1
MAQIGASGLQPSSCRYRVCRAALSCARLRHAHRGNDRSLNAVRFPLNADVGSDGRRDRTDQGGRAEQDDEGGGRGGPAAGAGATTAAPQSVGVEGEGGAREHI